MREIDLEEFVDEIYEDRENDTKYIFFLGAGCSKSSGIPLAGELAEKWYEKLKKQKTKLNNFNKDNNIKDDKPDNFPNLYFKIFESLFPTPLSQQKEIQRITENITPSSGYYTLASLMQKPCFNSVITTNFDNLIQDALIYSGDKRALVITHQDLAKFIERNNTPLIVKVHGDSHMDPFNNTDNTKKIPDELNGAIQGLFINTKLVFIGYSGSDESIRDLLIDSKRIDHVYWFSSNLPSDNKLTEWWNSTSSKTFVKERDFDMIMGLIKFKFELEEPNFDLMATRLKKSYDNSLKEENKEIEIIKQKTEIEYLILGNNYLGTKEYKKAIESYENAIEKNSENSNAYYNLGIIYSNIKEYEKEIDSYAKAIEINSEYLSAYYNLGNAYSNNKEYQKAIDTYKEGIKINPNASDMYYYMGSTYYKNEEYEKSIVAFKEGIRINPNDSDIHYGLGDSYNSNKEYEKAISAYKEGIKINPNDSDMYYGLGNTYTSSGEYEKAKLSYIKAIEINPNDSDIHYGLGVSYNRNKEYEKAKLSYIKAIEINPEEISPYINLFELEIIKNITLDKKYHKQYVSLITKNNESLLEYDMLIILKNIIENNNYSINSWKVKYKDESLTDWCFNNIDAWILKQKPDIKKKLLTVMKVFKSKLETT